MLHERALDGVLAMLPDIVSTAPHVRLLQWRLHRDISVEDVAKKAGVMPEVIRKIEAGKSGYTMRMLQRASRALDIPFDVMLGHSPKAAPAELTAIWERIPADRQEVALKMLRALTLDH
jgi:transcriptional regulator with XRE-family HTH domain